jgi:hypothetical protein
LKSSRWKRGQRGWKHSVISLIWHSTLSGECHPAWRQHMQTYMPTYVETFTSIFMTQLLLPTSDENSRHPANLVCSSSEILIDLPTPSVDDAVCRPDTCIVFAYAQAWLCRRDLQGPPRAVTRRQGVSCARDQYSPPCCERLLNLTCDLGTLRTRVCEINDQGTQPMANKWAECSIRLERWTFWVYWRARSTLTNETWHQVTPD